MGSVFRRGDGVLGQVSRERSADPGVERLDEGRRREEPPPAARGGGDEGRPSSPASSTSRSGTSSTGSRPSTRRTGAAPSGGWQVSLAHLRPAFGARRAVARHGRRRHDLRHGAPGRAEAANATINRELAALKRAYRLALAGGAHRPGRAFRCSRRTTSGRDSSSARQFEAVRATPAGRPSRARHGRLHHGLAHPTELRRSSGGRSTSRPGRSGWSRGRRRTRDGRMFVMTPELRAALEAQRAATERASGRGG